MGLAVNSCWEVGVMNYIRLVYYKEDIVLYIKLQLFLEWVGFRTYESRVETKEDMERIFTEEEYRKWEDERTIFFYRSQMREYLEVELVKRKKEGKKEENPFIVLCHEKEEFLQENDLIVYGKGGNELPYTSILEKIHPELLNKGIRYILTWYQSDMVRSFYTMTRLYHNSKINYKKSRLLEEVEWVIVDAIQALENFAREENFSLEENLHFFYAVNYLKDLQNAKRKLCQEELAWSSQEIVDSLNQLLEKKYDFKSCYLLKVSVCEKQLVLNLLELPIFNLEHAQDELDYIAQYKLGVFYQNNQLDEEMALAQYKKCSITNAKYYRNLYKLALYHKSNENYEAALEYFLSIIKIIKEKEEIDWETEEFEYYYKTQYFMARIYLEIKEYLEANLAYQKAFQIWSGLKKSKVVKEIYKGQEESIRLFMQNKYDLEEKRKDIMDETGLFLGSIKW